MDEAIERAWLGFKAALDAGRPKKIMASALAGLTESPTKIIALGKAAGAMAQACRDGGLEAEGLLITHDPAIEVAGFTTIVGGHPMPDSNSLEAGGLCLSLAESLGEQDHLLMLLSGGGSALMCSPAGDLTLDDKVMINSALLGSGLDIHQMNGVRRLFSQVKGGRLAEAAWPAKITQWVLSDVPSSGDEACDLAAIASGPMAADPVAFDEACESVKQAGLDSHPKIKSHLEAMRRDPSLQPLRLGDKAFERVNTQILASNESCVEAAKAALGESGESVGGSPLPPLRGDAGEMGRKLGALALKHGAGLTGITGGETTVTLPPTKDDVERKGGRCQHLALSFMLTMFEANPNTLNWLILAAGSDGRDGATDAAGAILHSDMIHRGEADLSSGHEALATYNSWHFLNRIGGLIRLPPTGTNFADIVIILTW